MTREQAIHSLIAHGFKVEQVGEIIKAVTPQFSSELEKNSKKLEKDFGELDCISRKAVLDLIADYDLSMGQVVKGVHALPSVTPQEPRWIPLTKRPMTDEETEHYFEYTDMRIDDTYTILDCPLPDDGQEVLVSYGGYVCVDTFCKDDGCYFEGVDIDDVDAWMPLPAPFEPQESER